MVPMQWRCWLSPLRSSRAESIRYWVSRTSIWFSDRHRCGTVPWSVAIVIRQRRLFALLQFLFPASDLYIYDHRSERRRRLCLFHDNGDCGLERGCACPYRGDRSPSIARAQQVFSRKLAGVGTLDDVLATAWGPLMLKVRVVLLPGIPRIVAVKAGYPPEDTLDDADIAAAKWASDQNRGVPTRFPAPSACSCPRADRAWHNCGRDRRQGPMLTPDQRRSSTR